MFNDHCADQYFWVKIGPASRTGRILLMEEAHQLTPGNQRNECHSSIGGV